MRRKQLYAILFLGSSIVFLAAFVPASTFGDSELTLLMRRLFDEALAAKTAILEGREPCFEENAAGILSAKASAAEKTNNPYYFPAANAYLEALEQLKRADPDQRPAAFNAMVDACMACHRKVCPGPTVRIQKLYIKP
jgi:hypothetical protein